VGQLYPRSRDGPANTRRDCHCRSGDDIAVRCNGSYSGVNADRDGSANLHITEDNTNRHQHVSANSPSHSLTDRDLHTHSIADEGSHVHRVSTQYAGPDNQPR